MYLLTTFAARYHYVIVTSLVCLLVHVTLSSSKAISANDDLATSQSATGRNAKYIVDRLVKNKNGSQTDQTDVQNTKDNTPLIRKTNVPANKLPLQRHARTTTEAVVTSSIGTKVVEEKAKTKKDVKDLERLRPRGAMTEIDQLSSLQRGDVNDDQFGHVDDNGQHADNLFDMSQGLPYLPDTLLETPAEHPLNPPPDMFIGGTVDESHFGQFVPGILPSYVSDYPHQPAPPMIHMSRDPNIPFDPRQFESDSFETKRVKWSNPSVDWPQRPADGTGRTEVQSAAAVINKTRRIRTSSNATNSTSASAASSPDSRVTDLQLRTGTSDLNDVISGNETANGVDEVQDEDGVGSAGVEGRQGSEDYNNYEYQSTGNDDEDDEEESVKEVKTQKPPKRSPKKKVVKKKPKKQVEPVGQVQSGKKPASKPKKRKPGNVKPARSPSSTVSARPTASGHLPTTVVAHNPNSPTILGFSGSGSELTDQQRLLLQQQQQQQLLSASLQQQQQSAQQNQQLLPGLAHNDGSQLVLLPDGSVFSSSGLTPQQPIQFIDSSGALVTGVIDPSQGGQFQGVQFARQANSNNGGNGGNEGNFPPPFPGAAESNFGLGGPPSGDASGFDESRLQQQFGLPAGSFDQRHGGFGAAGDLQQFTADNADFLRRPSSSIHFGKPTDDGLVRPRESDSSASTNGDDTAPPTAEDGEDEADDDTEKETEETDVEAEAKDEEEDEAEDEAEAEQQTTTARSYTTKAVPFMKRRRPALKDSQKEVEASIRPDSTTSAGDEAPSDDVAGDAGDSDAEAATGGAYDWSQIKTGFEDDAEDENTDQQPPNSDADSGNPEAKVDAGDEDGGDDEGGSKKKPVQPEAQIDVTTPFSVKQPPVVKPVVKSVVTPVAAPVVLPVLTPAADSGTQTTKPAAVQPSSNVKLATAAAVSVTETTTSGHNLKVTSTKAPSQNQTKTTTGPTTTSSAITELPASTTASSLAISKASSIVTENPKPSNTKTGVEAVTVAASKGGGQATETTIPTVHGSIG